MPAPIKLTDVRNTALKQGVSTNRFRISREDAARVKAAEAKGDGLKTLLEILFKRR